MKDKKINRNTIKAGLYLSVLAIGLHSILLGGFIYFFTDNFYRFFFAASPENLFFVRQSGVFLFLLGVAYTFPLIRLEKRIYLIKFIIFTKIIAVLFLLINADLSRSPTAIYLAALGDGIMVIVLFFLLFAHLKIRGNQYYYSCLLR
ncbi:MAG: hypothetical protein OEV64_15225 [Desulfobulbaceae bacterium]|nr:hypothetical protein [Desulfobulbaceae bacterium]